MIVCIKVQQQTGATWDVTVIITLFFAFECSYFKISCIQYIVGKFGSCLEQFRCQISSTCRLGLVRKLFAHSEIVYDKVQLDGFKFNLSDWIHRRIHFLYFLVSLEQTLIVFAMVCCQLIFLFKISVCIMFHLHGTSLYDIGENIYLNTLSNFLVGYSLRQKYLYEK